MARATKASGYMISGFEVSKEVWDFFIDLKKQEMLSRNNYIRGLIQADMEKRKTIKKGGL